LDKTFTMDLLSQDDQNNQNELQGLLCGVLQVLITRLGKQTRPFADAIMTQVIKIFRTKKDAGVYEEAMLTANALIQVVEGDFKRYMNDLMPHLIVGLNDWQAHTGCNISVGIVGDIARDLASDTFPYCDKIITVLLQNLQNRDLDRAVKPTILSVFGDIALAIGGNFEKYLQVVMHMLKQAADTVMKTQIPDENFELIEYLNLLREGICEAYTGIIQGMKADSKVEKIFPYLGDIMSFVVHVSEEKQCNESVKRSAIGIVGDLASSFKTRVKTAVSHVLVQQLIVDCSTNTEYSKETRELAGWARQATQM